MINIGLNVHLLSKKRGYRTTGIHGYIYNLLTHLPAVSPPEWDYTAMVGADSPHKFDDITMQPSRFDTEAPVKRILWEQVAQPWQLRRFELYHAQAFVSPVLLTAPSVVTVYDLSFVHYPQVLSTARRLYLRLFTALSCHRAKRVIAISRSTAADVHRTFGIPAEKIDVAYGGYDTTSHVPLPTDEIEDFRRRKGLPARFWLFVGTLEPRKNLPTLLDAYAQLPDSERLPLVFGGGKGWLYDAIFERIERHQLEDHVHLAGFLPAEELPLWYNSAEVLLHPAVFEGFGLTVLEAMACGTPVVVSDASSLPEVAGESGLLVPPRDVEAWTATLRRIRHDASWRAEASARGLEAAAQFTWEATAAQTVACYRQALKQRKS